MAYQQRRPTVWPRWMHAGCLGCSVTLALALLITTGSIVYRVYSVTAHGTNETGVGRKLPLLPLNNGCIGAIRARGYKVTSAAYLPDGRIVIAAAPTMDMGKIFGTALRSSGKPGAPAASMAELMSPRIVVLGPDGPQEMPLPSSQDSFPDIRGFVVDKSGTRLMASVMLSSMPTTYTSTPNRSSAYEAWLLNLTTGKWTKILRVPGTQRLHFAQWLPDGSAVLGRPQIEDPQQPVAMWAINTSGDVRTIAKMPGLYAYHVLGDTGHYRLAGLANTGKGGSSQWHVVTADLATGKLTDTPLTELPDLHPGPLSADESAVFIDNRVAAVDWRLARARFITWPMETLGKIYAAPGASWAFASEVESYGGYSSSRQILAIDLADGKTHLAVSDLRQVESAQVLAAGPSGMTFLVSTTGYFSSPFEPENGTIMEVFADAPALAASPEAGTSPTGSGASRSGSGSGD